MWCVRQYKFKLTMLLVLVSMSNYTSNKVTLTVIHLVPNKSNTRELSEVCKHVNQNEIMHTKRTWKREDIKFFKEVPK